VIESDSLKRKGKSTHDNDCCLITVAGTKAWLWEPVIVNGWSRERKKVMARELPLVLLVGHSSCARITEVEVNLVK